MPRRLRIGLGLAPAFLISWVVLLAAVPSRGKDRVGDGPHICVIAPQGISAGTNVTLKIRGLKLVDAIGVSFRSDTQPLKATITEHKTADVPAGFEAKEAGDSLVVASVDVLSGITNGELPLSVVTPDGTTEPRAIQMVNAAVFMEEKEPNDGFASAQNFPFGKRLFGSIGSDKDVDVFKISGRAKKTVVVDVVAARAGSLLDGLLTLYDVKGRVLATSDDSSSSRDPQLRFQLPVDGVYFLALQDASDHGTTWHTYEISAKEEP